MRCVVFSSPRHGDCVLTDETEGRPTMTHFGRRGGPETRGRRPVVVFMGCASGPDDPVPEPMSGEAPSGRLLIEMWLGGDFASDPSFFEVSPEARELGGRFLSQPPGRRSRR